MTHHTADPREAAWYAVHDALPAYWMVGLITFDPGRRQFSVTARSPHPGRGRMPVTVSGAAKRELLNRRLRQAFYQGAEEEAADRGRSLEHVELERVLGRYPGDL